jgi:hypothetical protein
MRQYVVDELRPEERERIKEYLDTYCELSDIKGLYWIRIPDDMLSSIQCEHRDCQPYCAAVELGDRFVKFEMLIRSRKKIRCKCVGFATPKQRDFLFSFIDTLINETRIRA